MVEGIFRKPTAQDMELIGTDLNKPKRQKTIHELFAIEIGQEEVKATKKGLPFARHAAKDDFANNIATQRNTQLREFGEIVKDIKIPVMDWQKYSDIKNFKLIGTKYRSDSEISKHNPGLNIQIETKVYKYKGYHNKYTIMEDTQSAIKRAQTKQIKERS